MTTTDLTVLSAGQSGTVVRLDGGFGVVKKLGNMGVRPGVRITKISSQIMRGPIIIGIGRARLAIGHGMAKRIIVGVD